MFFCECWEMFKYSFLYRTHLVHYTFQKFYVKKELPRCLRVQNWYFSDFLCHCFVFHNSSVRMGSPLLFRIYLVFIPQFSLSVTLARVTRTAPLLFLLNHKVKKTPELQRLIRVIYCEKCEYELFEYAMLSFFFRSGLARHG